MDPRRLDVYGRPYSASASDSKEAQIRAELAMTPLQRVELALSLGEHTALIGAARSKAR